MIARASWRFDVVLSTEPKFFVDWIETELYFYTMFNSNGDYGHELLIVGYEVFPPNEDSPHTEIVFDGVSYPHEGNSKKYNDGYIANIEIRQISNAFIQIFGECQNDRYTQWFEEVEKRIIEVYEISNIKINFVLGDETPDVMDHEIFVPSSSAVKHRWKVIWRHTRGIRDKGKSLTFIVDWLQKMHTEVACREDTLRKIFRAGEAGKLE